MDSGQFSSPLLSQQTIIPVEHDNGDGDMPHRVENGAPTDGAATDSVPVHNASVDGARTQAKLQAAAGDSTNGWRNRPRQPLDTLVIPGAVDVSTREPEEVARAQVRALIQHTMQTRAASNTDLLMRAYAFAHDKHEGQMRMTGEPYIEHPVAVAGILAELGMDDPTIAAGLLHDVMEDCAVDFDDMVRRFGMEVAQLIDGVTKLKHIDFSSKQEKQAENLRKLFLAMAGDVRVIIIKLADRLHNMRTLDPFPEQRKREISSETLHIWRPSRIAWASGASSGSWKTAPSNTSSPISTSRYTRWCSARAPSAAKWCAIRSRSSTSVCGRKAFRGSDGRPKHFYSIYQKMIKQGRKFNELHDLIALRVICTTVPDCYHALGVVHSLWMQVPEMFFDYIAKPKPNNYQSLHTKVLGPDRRAD
jgi:GTP pyrophosphokinase